MGLVLNTLRLGCLEVFIWMYLAETGGQGRRCRFVGYLLGGDD